MTRHQGAIWVDWFAQAWNVCTLMLFMVMPTSAAEQGTGKFALTFDRVSIQQLVTIYYDECEKKALVFDPVVLKSDETVTLKTPAMDCAGTRVIMSAALARAKIEIESRATFDLVKPGSVKDERDGWQELIYKPRFKEAVDLAEIAQIAVRKGSFAHQRRGAQVQLPADTDKVADTGSNGASISNKPVDQLVFFGPASEARALEGLLGRLDVPDPQVEIRAGIYEFQQGRAGGSAVNAVLKLFGQNVGVSVSGGTGSTAGSSVKISLPNLDAALSLLDTDSRFRYVSRPKVLTKNRDQVRFFSGEDVRVTGAIVLDRNGNPIQSKETLSAGITLEATPRIRADVVELDLFQAVSNFSADSNGEPSILKRELRSHLVVQPGAVYLIGGLQSSRSTRGSQRFFGFQVGGDNQENMTEIVLLLTVQSDRIVSE